MPSFVTNSIVQRFTTPFGHGGLEGHELRTVIFIAISFKMVFTGYRAIQNLQSSLNEEHGMGVTSLGVLHGAWIFSGLITPTALRFLTTKGALMVAWVCHALYTACTFYPAWGLIIPASLLVGTFSAPLWTSQSLYITACGYSRAKYCTGNPYHTYSRLNGIFFAIFETSQITGNLISSLVLQSGVGNRTAVVVFQQCGKGDCPSADNATDFEEPEPWVSKVLLAVYLSFCFLCLVVTYLFVMPLPQSYWTIETSTRKTVTSFFVTLRRTAIGLLVPMFIFQGMQQAILYSEFTRSYISCPLGIHMVGFVMATHGAVTPITTWLFSRVVKLTGRYLLFLLAGLINLGLMVIMYLWTPDHSDELFIFLTPIAWGLSEGIWMTQSSSITAVLASLPCSIAKREQTLIAVQFDDRKEAAFAIYHTCRSIGLALTFTYSSRLCASVKLILGMSFVLLALLTYTVSEIRLQWNEKRKREVPDPEGAVSQLALSTISGRLDLDGGRPDSVSMEPMPRYLESVGSGQTLTGEFEDDDEVFDDPSSPGISSTDLSMASVFVRLPRVASSSSSILSSLQTMARLSQCDDDELVTSLPSVTQYQKSRAAFEEQLYY